MSLQPEPKKPEGCKPQLYFLIEDILLCLKYNNKNKIYMYSIEHDNVFVALVATSYGRYDHHQPMLYKT